MISAACVHPEDSGLQVIVGAKLEAGPGIPAIDHSVVVISSGKIQAVGPQASTPVPIGSKMTNGLGMTILPLPGGEPIEAGRPANLVLKGPDSSTGERIMRAGVWDR
jgi:hypothetical protein